ncbi:MAG: hypothetical protein AAFZ63_25760 [Bacteroidota bacterium]
MIIDLCQDRIASGYRLVDVETYQKGNTQRYAGIWEPSDQNENRWSNIGLGSWLNEKHSTYLNSDYELLNLEKY